MASGLDICDIALPSELDEAEAGLSFSSVVALPHGSFYLSEKSSLHARIKVDGLHPATVIYAAENRTVKALDATIQRFLACDDVFDRSFLASVVFVTSSVFPEPLSPDMATFLKAQGTRRVAILDESFLTKRSASLSEGPYFMNPTGLFRVWKLQPDTQGAFVASLIQHESKQIAYLNAATAEAAPNLTIAVPSRLYYPSTPELPLNGLRVALKDNIDVAGAKTFASSKSYGQFYGIVHTSAPAAQRLLDLGAVIIGKTGMSQFADAEAPTGDFVDFHAPSNPRGDGNRTAGGSSYGSGAATAAYGWLDFTLGTDTGGSVRVPAANNGVFGLRPSRGLIPVDGTVIIHRDLDAVGILARDLDLVKRVAVPFYQLPPSASSHPPRFIFPLHLFAPVEDDKTKQLYERVAQSIESILQVKRESLDFGELWKKCKADTQATYSDYFAATLFEHLAWGSYNERSKFRQDYQQKFNKFPMVNPLTRYRWHLGERLDKEQFDKTISRREEFQSFIESIFGENTFMLTPFLFMEPEPKDMYRPAPVDRDNSQTGYGLRPAYQAPMAGQPEIVFPIGQEPHLSSITQVEELYGVMASIVGSRGNDLAVIHLALQVLDGIGIPRTVLTGRAPFAE
ncbi:amidase signature domain-containing protein [Ilyonectria sp. MPI-CAGE-AT-0026]|nr:amidase signature domain-containing protein [Ilyonectria sp. MPI-CAGE-AT-0026]